MINMGARHGAMAKGGSDGWYSGPLVAKIVPGLARYPGSELMEPWMAKTL
jgi:hypothetical protein